MRAFLCDGMLGDVSRWLRLLGFDAAYAGNVLTDGEILADLTSTGRFLVTRDEQLHGRAEARGLPSVLVPKGSLVDVLAATLVASGEAVDEHAWFSRCTTCGTRLAPRTRADVQELVPPAVAQTHNEFHQCPNCNQVFWPGTHAAPIRATLEAVGARLASLNTLRNEP